MSAVTTAEPEAVDETDGQAQPTPPRTFKGTGAVVEVVEVHGYDDINLLCPNTIRVNGVALYSPAHDPVVVERIERLVVNGGAQAAARVTITALAYLTQGEANAELGAPLLLGDGTKGGVFELVLPDVWWVNSHRGCPLPGEHLRPESGVFVNNATTSVGVWVSADDPVIVGPPVDRETLPEGAAEDRVPVRVTLSLLAESLTMRGERDEELATRYRTLRAASTSQADAIAAAAGGTVVPFDPDDERNNLAAIVAAMNTSTPPAGAGGPDEVTVQLDPGSAHVPGVTDTGQ